MKHSNPYRINDPDNIFEVVENSSHPGLNDRRRVWHFKGRTFRTSAEVMRYFDAEGLDYNRYWILPKQQPDADGTVTTHVNIVERVPPEERALVKEFNKKWLVG